jgi:polysaccharide export outer membrane protein
LVCSGQKESAYAPQAAKQDEKRVALMSHSSLRANCLVKCKFLPALTAMAMIAFCGCSILDTEPLGTQSADLSQHPALSPQPGETSAISEEGRFMPEHTPPASSPPSELAKVSLPKYRVSPPDVLLLQGVRLVPKDPYYIQTNDYLQIIVANSLPDQPIAGPFQVSSGGMVSLGGVYDSVKVSGLTIDEAQAAIAKHLSRIIAQPQVSVSLLQPTGMQQIFGEHLIGPDGTINLGIYGTVYVAGMTVEEVRAAIEKQLSQYLDEPKVSVDVLIYNSNYYYIFTQGAGFGDNMVRIPITGNETVLDAIAQIGGTSQASGKRIWISRPAPKDMACDQILPVDWDAITHGGSTATNYQLMPGDRVFIAQDPFLAANSFVNKVINPVERLLGFTLLGSQTIQFLQRFPQGFGF